MNLSSIGRSFQLVATEEKRDPNAVFLGLFVDLNFFVAKTT